MKKLLAALLFMCGYASFAQNDYDDAWKALNENKKAEAEKLLAKINVSDPRYIDAYLTGMYLKAYNGKEKTISDFTKTMFAGTTNPYPYVYALWFNSPVLGDYGKKNFDYQLKLVDQLIADEKAPGTIRAAANYQKGMHLLFSNDFDKVQKYYDAVGNIQSWQYVGPFENLSQSGFYKNYGPLDHPEPAAVFKSITNADIKWFTPADEIKDGWTPVVYQFNRSTGVVYAQNFVSADKDQSVYCNVGASGSVKVWINDELVIAESKERVTEMDAYTIKCSLKQGTNRVLVQLGFSDMSFPNFSVRFTDENYNRIPGITGSAAYAAYPKVTNSTKKYALVPLFAEAYFKDKLQKEPSNLVNYLLLSDVYLRNKKVIEARNLLTDALKLSPDNSMVRMKLIEVLLKEKNNTLVQEEVEKIKLADPESLLVMELKIKELFDAEKYEDGEAELKKRISMFGEDETTSGYKILLLVHDKKYDELVKEAERMYAAYPDNTKLLNLMYSIRREVYKDNKGAMKLYENYLKKNYSYDVIEDYASKLEEMGSNDKALDLKQKLAKSFLYSPSGFSVLASYYYTAKDYNKAEDNIKKALALSPYNEDYWSKLGDIANERNNNADALSAYTRSLQYDPNQYDIINKVRKLKGQKELYKFFPEIDVNKVIKEDKPEEAKNTDYGYYYILNQKDVIIYPGGANEEYYTILLRIINDKGVDAYKESSIGYGNSQNLLIDKAEIIKKNQSHIQGERNGNEVVFTNLEVGDILVFKYRLQSYVYGRFEKEYWDRFFFGSKIYNAISKYNLIVPAEQKINYRFENSDVKPVIKDVDAFKEYSWEITKAQPLKDERLMPQTIDAAPVLHLSTIFDWKEIGDWYSDVVNNKAEEDFEIMALYNKLFPDPKKPMTQFQKAKTIYDYIEANIRYSSVSFRQSAFVPQRPSATLTTRLGDCKDLSSLFVTLAHMSGINAQMVLVDTRDNGQKEILLPGIEFNHCIAKAMLDNKPYYIELTDNYLPFASLPNNLNGASILEIPSKNMSDKSIVQPLRSTTRTKDKVKRIIDIKPEDSDLNITVRAIKWGSNSSSTRSAYLNLDAAKQLEEMEKSIAGSYKNNVKMKEVKFSGLDKLDDSVSYTYNYKVRNEVSEIGALNTFKIIYPDVVASLDNFSSDTREYPVEYWKYEDTDNYETVVNVTAPAGKKFVELPVSENLAFGDMKFSIQYTLKTPDKLVVTRKFQNTRQQQVSPQDYPAFKSFFEKIVKAEQKFIAYK